MERLLPLFSAHPLLPWVIQDTNENLKQKEMMFFSKKKKEEKKLQKELAQESKEKAQEFSEKITQAHENLNAQGSLLTKDLKGSETVGKTGFFAKLIAGLAKTKRLLVGGILELASEDAADADFLEELEERLIVADLGAATVMKIIEMVQKKLDLGELKTQADVVEEVKSIISHILDQGDHAMPFSEEAPTVYLFVGVNGVGKTTTIGKLAAKYKAEGKKVLVAAGDTFRAAAIEQMAEWCRRADIDLVKKEIGSDPSAVLYEAAERAKKENYDILLCDTSGRLHTKDHLMDELKKMKRAIQKVLPTAPHASILVLDANTGQNAIVQTKEFTKIVDLDGLVVTKLDGTAKGGVVIGIVNEFELPIYYIGVGESVEDLQPFSASEFSESLFDS